jgi:hypothetical protein
VAAKLTTSELETMDTVLKAAKARVSNTGLRNVELTAYVGHESRDPDYPTVVRHNMKVITTPGALRRMSFTLQKQDEQKVNGVEFTEKEVHLILHRPAEVAEMDRLFQEYKFPITQGTQGMSLRLVGLRLRLIIIG